MNCDEVVRELLVPSGAITGPALEGHLAECALCSQEAEALARLDRAWHATRPAEPSDRSWNRLWYHVTQATETPATLPFRSTVADRARRWWFAAIAAQAAVVVLFLYAPARPGKAPLVVQNTLPGTVSAPAPLYEMEIEAGQTLILEVNENGNQVVCKPRLETTRELLALDESDTAEPVAVAVWDMNLLNGMESIAELASTE